MPRGVRYKEDPELPGMPNTALVDDSPPDSPPRPILQGIPSFIPSDLEQHQNIIPEAPMQAPTAPTEPTKVVKRKIKKKKKKKKPEQPNIPVNPIENVGAELNQAINYNPALEPVINEFEKELGDNINQIPQPVTPAPMSSEEIENKVREDVYDRQAKNLNRYGANPDFIEAIDAIPEEAIQREAGVIMQRARNVANREQQMRAVQEVLGAQPAYKTQVETMKDVAEGAVNIYNNVLDTIKKYKRYGQYGLAASAVAAGIYGLYRLINYLRANNVNNAQPAPAPAPAPARRPVRSRGKANPRNRKGKLINRR